MIFSKEKDNQMADIVHFLKNTNCSKKIHWKTISATLLKKTWLLFGKRNIVNENAIDKIATQILDNICRLEVCNELTGHSENYHVKEEILENFGIEFTDEEWEKIWWDCLSNEKGQDFISDYGIGPLKNLYIIIFNANTPEEKLYACDKALNVVHQRNDLAAMFVEGGQHTLTQVATQGGYNADYTYAQMNREYREGVGAGIPETDPLHIKGERWRIDWGKRKTPLMK